MSGPMANADLVADYLGEAHDYLDQLNRLLLALTEGGGPWPIETVHELFRSAHSLKGLSACFGFERTNAVTHELESLLVLVRDGKLVPHQAVVRCMFAAIDLVGHLTTEIASSGQERAETAILLEQLRKVVHEPVGELAATSSATAGKETAAAANAARSPGSEQNETVRVRMDRLDRMVNLTGELVITRSRLHLVTRQLRPLQRVHEWSSLGHEMQRGLEELAAGMAAGQGDNLLPLLAELRSRQEALQAGLGDLAGLGRGMRDLDEAIYDLDGVTGGIHEAVLQLRMVPLETVFRRLQRVVRDTAELLHKSVVLEVVGSETQIDKRVADELVNPLVHILRNAVDHGIETPAERRERGKGPQGCIRVSAFQRGSSVVIEVDDDGGGIDPDRLRQKAVENGVLSAEEAAAMPDAEAQRLIFAPGFSTAKQVTEVSGRGMGMDIVAASIKQLRGTLELESKVGQGSRFTIQLPPSMSILSSLLLEVRNTMFALPLTEVREIVELSRLRTHKVQGRPTIVVREQPMPLVALPSTYHFPGEPAAAAPAAPEHAVVFGSGGAMVALAVDRLLGKEDLVLKPVCAELAAVPGLAGMAIRGDGRVTLVLDPVGFADHALGRGLARKRRDEAGACAPTA